MILRATQSILTVSILVLLTACGGADLPPDGAGQGSALAAQGAATASVKTTVAATSTAGAQPLPDCHAEGCAGLRIIDGNAEAYRIDAMRRAQQGS